MEASFFCAPYDPAGWIDAAIYILSTVFRTYQDDGKVIRKDCVQ